LNTGLGGARANGDIFIGGISANGRIVALTSIASNLVPDDTNGEQDVFVRDLRTRRTTRVSVGQDGAQADGGSGFASLSGDGRYVAFDSNATNLVPGDTNGTQDVFVHDRRTGRMKRVSVTAGGDQADRGGQDPELSADGRFVAFHSDATNLVPRDTNGVFDVFVATHR
jgi:Tol biopolymer transport system component